MFFCFFLLQSLANESERKEKLSTLLMLPLQRIPRYVLLMTALNDATPPKHPDSKRCIKSLDKIKEVAEFVNKEKQIAENMQQLAEIDSLISGGADVRVLLENFKSATF